MREFTNKIHKNKGMTVFSARNIVTLSVSEKFKFY